MLNVASFKRHFKRASTNLHPPFCLFHGIRECMMTLCNLNLGRTIGKRLEIFWRMFPFHIITCDVFGTIRYVTCRRCLLGVSKLTFSVKILFSVILLWQAELWSQSLDNYIRQRRFKRMPKNQIYNMAHHIRNHQARYWLHVTNKRRNYGPKFVCENYMFTEKTCLLVRIV